MYLFIICALYQIVYQLLLVSAITKNKSRHKKNSSASQKSVSVIICAKNENENLRKNLPSILNQKYNDFEVILVDDGSDEYFNMVDDRLRIIRLTQQEKIGLGKKYALQKGIENVAKELILLTDADCKPVSEYWIAEMANLIDDKHKIVLGISPYTIKNTLLNALIEYETAQTAMQYIGFAILGNPYMSVGRNVGYDATLLRTKIWKENELAIASGDDDLTIQALATDYNTTVCLDVNSYTVSEAKNTWKDWFVQKRRHAESGLLYKFSHKILLGSYIISKLLFYILVLCIYSSGNNVFTVNVIALVSLSMMSIVNMKLNTEIKMQKRWIYTIVLDPLYAILLTIIGVLNFIQSNQKWK